MRFVILIAIVFVHIAVFFLLAARHRSLERPQTNSETTLILLGLPSAAGQLEPSAPTMKAHPARRSEHIARDKIIQSPDESVDARSRPAPVDWELEAQMAASEWAEAVGNAERKASDRAHCHRPLFAQKARVFVFDWFHAPTRRADPGSGWPLVFRISERCSGFSLLNFLGVGCSLGKIEARGDLFLHMHGPVQYGDWMNIDPNPNAAEPSCDALGTSPAMQ